MALLLLIFDAFNSFAFIFISCELGQRLSDAFNEINDVIDRSEWNLFKNEFKRILPMIMIISQEPVMLECFGRISCCRDVFNKVRKITVSINFIF